MKKADVISEIFCHSLPLQAKREKGLAFAPTNIALCKYWGKRDPELNLPMTSSLSVSLLDKGAMTTLTMHDAKQDAIYLNNRLMAPESTFVIRTVQFLDLFRPDKKWHLNIDIKMDIL